LINSDIAILKANFTKLKSKITSNNNGTGIEEMVPKFEASSIVYNDIDSQGLTPKVNEALDHIEISKIK